MYKTCMVSKIPLTEGEKVRVFLLAATGDYNSRKAIFTNESVYAWDGFKIVGGVSVKGRIDDYGRVVFEKDINYDYLNFKMSGFFGSDIKIEDVPQMIRDNELHKSYAQRANFFINIAYVKEDIYKSLMKAYKEESEDFKEIFEYVLEEREEYLKERSKQKSEEDFQEDANMYLSEGISPCMVHCCHLYDNNIFNVFKTLNKNLTDEDVFKIIESDYVFARALNKNCITICPTPLSETHDGFDEARVSYYQDSLLSYLKAKNKFTDSIKTKPHVKILQEIKIKDLDSFFKYEDYEEERKGIQKLKDKFVGQSKVIIERKDFKHYPFIEYCLDEQPGDVIIVF